MLDKLLDREANLRALRRITATFLVLGPVFLLFTAGLAIAHFGFGMPMTDAKTGRPLPPEQLREFLGAFAQGGVFATLVGILLRLIVGRFDRNELGSARDSHL